MFACPAGVQCEAQVSPPTSPRSAKRWEQLYGNDEVTAQKQRAHALYEVGGVGGQGVATDGFLAQKQRA